MSTLLKLIQLKVDVDTVRVFITTLIDDVLDKEYSREIIKARLEKIVKEIDESLKKVEIKSE